MSRMKDAVSRDCDNVNIMIEYKDNLQQVILNGENITSRLRTEEVANTASAVAVYPAVRKNL